MKALANAMSKGALARFTNLQLRDNKIGDEGMKALAIACARGALAPGARIYLGNNKNATETGKQAMHNAVKARGLEVTF